MNKMTDISLKEYFDTRFLQLREYMDIRFQSIEKSTCLAQDNLNRRIDGMNEFRNAMKDQAAKFITREELALMLDPIGKDIRQLLETQAEAKGMASQKSVLVAYGISLVAILISVAKLFIK